LGADSLSGAFALAYHSTAFARGTLEQTAKLAAFRARAVKDALRRIEHPDLWVISSYQPEGIVCHKWVAANGSKALE
jgi:hypothetical protein